MCFLVEVPHGFFRFTNEKWQVNSFHYVAKFSIMGLMCFLSVYDLIKIILGALFVGCHQRLFHNEW